ncbi:hypothetical protein Xen7305DRAFT_00020340 [Xenococcus sp. PCC 7305]|uniref:hypothetical protein n=1 Tax=Xenococcus sp. PCC 7305 TaxID=102125 RepID=UPI0002AC6EE3|nr:hypothetical protein [Xenococcus sp. PCC 7305]ELS02320.1 hypothetical protein Xen7305DRAFT_00020340 [Xenococcus sp. PCC 7305]
MSSETKSYEAQMLGQLIKNAESIAVVKEKLSVVEEKLTKVEATANRAEWWLRFIAGAVVLSFFKEQLISFF